MNIGLKTRFKVTPTLSSSGNCQFCTVLEKPCLVVVTLFFFFFFLGGGGLGGVSGSRDMSPQKFVQNSESLRLGNNDMIQVEAFKVDMNSLAIIFLLE